jgi:PQQ-like domain
MRQRYWWMIGAAVGLVILIFLGWSDMKKVEESSTGKAPELPSDIAWSHTFTAVSDLAATSSGLAASVVFDKVPTVVGLEAGGRLSWQKQIGDQATLVAGRQSLFAATGRQIMSIDTTDGSIAATRDVDPPGGGWAKATTLCIDDDLVILHAGGLARLDARELKTQWQVALPLDDANDAVRQLVHEPPWIAAVSNHAIVLISDRGDVNWKRQLPQDTRLAGSSPLVLAHGRLWVALARISTPGARFLYELSTVEGKPGPETVINDLAMFCPAYVSSGVLVLNTQGGLAGFDVQNDLHRLWSIEVPVALGACVAADRKLLVASSNGTLLRVAFADGSKETISELPRKLAWVPPAPDLEPGTYTQSAGSIEHLALLPRGVAFSVSWSNEQASILFHPL